MAMIALTVTLTTICVDPSASDCKSTLPACRSMNWAAATDTASQLSDRGDGQETDREDRPGLSKGKAFTSNGDRPPGRNAAQASQSRYAAPVREARHRRKAGENERAETECRAQHVEDKSKRDAAE